VKSRFFSDIQLARTIISLAVFIFTITAVALASHTYKEPNGRFDIDVPDNWELHPQEEETVYTFGEGENIGFVMQYVPGKTDRETLFSMGVNMFKSSIPEAKPEGDVIDQEVNGHPARWGVYEGEVEAMGMKITLLGLIGGLVLDEGGIVFFASTSPSSRDKMESLIKEAFHSIRTSGASVTGASTGSTMESTEIQTGHTIPEGDKTTFTHDLATFQLPPGWEAQEMGANIEKEAVGIFSCERLMGATMIVTGHKGFGMNMGKVITAVETTVEASMPNCNVIERDEDVELPNGKKATMLIYKGKLVREGQEIPMGAISATAKGKKSYVSLITFVAESETQAVKQEMLEIIRTVQ
jgi:hypothetical protein